jgi:wobble nucleotide-excising tRNase
MIERIQLIRNIGQFDSVSAGNQISLTELTLVYAENARGKTTLAAILRSLGSGDPVPIIERQRLAAANPPHVVITSAGGTPVVFQNGAWSRPLADIAVFDDLFVAENVYTGLAVDAAQRQNLHELILGAQGVALNKALQTHVAKIEEHNRALRARAEAIPAPARGSLSVDAFCALKQRSDIDAAIRETERNLAAAQSADAVRTRETFEPITLPEFETTRIAALLQRGLPDLEAAAAARVQAHFTKLGPGGEAWAEEGMRRAGIVAAAGGQEICPFCAQDLHGSFLIEHYRAYFSEAYEGLKQLIDRELANFRSKHGGEIVAAFERSVRVTIELRQFWSQFAEILEVSLDTAEIARAWKAAQEPLLRVLLAKQAAPLERLALPSEAYAAVTAYNRLRGEITSLSDELMS